MEVVAFVKVCAIEPPVPLDAPVMFGALTVHENVVPAIEYEVEIEMLAACCEQRLALEGFAVTCGVGFTVTTADAGAELQIPAWAITE